MFSEMIINNEGDFFFADGKTQEEISLKEAIDIMVTWEDNHHVVYHNVQSNGLIEQWYIK